jgi:hypothetical protein
MLGLAMVAVVVVAVLLTPLHVLSPVAAKPTTPV